MQQYLEENLWHYGEEPTKAKLLAVVDTFTASWRTEVLEHASHKYDIEKYDSAMAIRDAADVVRL